MMQRWQDLFAQLEVINQGTPDIFTEADLLAFEAQIGIILPIGYKEFCQVFGSGSFGDSFMDVWCPSIEVSEELIGFHRDAIKWQVEAEWVKTETKDVAQTESLLNSAFMFGGSSREEELFWDLRTYSQSDQSYDIYLAHFESIKPSLVGRNFFEFVYDICLGLNPQKVFPEQLQPYLNEICLTFTR